MSGESSRSIYPYCSVPKCKKNPKHTCFTLPSDPEKAKVWCEQLRIDINSKRKIFVCEVHLEDIFLKDLNDSTTDFVKVKFPKLTTLAVENSGNGKSTRTLGRTTELVNMLENKTNAKLYPSTTQVAPTLNPPVDETNIFDQITKSEWKEPTVLDVNEINTNFESKILSRESPTSKDKNINKRSPNSRQYGLTSNLLANETDIGTLSTILRTTSGFHITETETDNNIQSPTSIVAKPILNVPKKENSVHSDYNDLLMDIITKSLNFTTSQKETGKWIKPLETRPELPSTVNKRHHKDNNTCEIQNKKHKTDPEQNQTDSNDPDYIFKTMEEIKNQISSLPKLPNALMPLAIKVYLRHPQAYKVLHTSLNFPAVSSLKKFLYDHPISLDDDKLFVQLLRCKLSIMSNLEQHCIVCLGETFVKKNLYLDIKLDKLLGISDIGYEQRPEIARRALILTVQGLFSDWKQPIAVAYVSDYKGVHTTITEWIHSNMNSLLKIGYNVRAFVSEADYLPCTITTIEQKTIYTIYDVPSLYKLLYYNFFTHDFFYNGGFVRRSHILAFYEIDSKKHLKLCPQLTDKHMKLNKIQDINLKLVTQIISYETAAAMSAYIDFKVLDQTALHTVQFIFDMSSLFEILYSYNVNESMKLVSGDSHIPFLRRMLSLLNDIKVVNIKTNIELTAGATFIEKFQTTIKSILMLYSDIKSNNESQFIPTRRLSLDNIGLFLDRTKELHNNSKKPSCKEINRAFIKSALLNISKPINYVKFVDLEKSLIEIKQLLQSLLSPHDEVPDLDDGAPMKINNHEYNDIDLKRKDAVVYLAGFILKKCYDRHPDCEAMKNYVCIVLHDTSSICKTILNEIHRGVCVVPQENFIEFVEMMEIKFRSFMAKDILETDNGKIINGLTEAMQLVNFYMPCRCFPVLYAKKLYLRVRINNMLKHNNNILSHEKKKMNHMLVVNNL